MHCHLSGFNLFLGTGPDGIMEVFLDPHLTTYHSNIGVQIILVLDLGTATL
jgi:hypothetical protein